MSRNVLVSNVRSPAGSERTPREQLHFKLRWVVVVQVNRAWRGRELQSRDGPPRATAGFSGVGFPQARRATEILRWAPESTMIARPTGWPRFSVRARRRTPACTN